MCVHDIDSLFVCVCTELPTKLLQSSTDVSGIHAEGGLNDTWATQ